MIIHRIVCCEAMLFMATASAALPAQQELWFMSSDAADEYLGFVDVGADVDGDGIPEFLVGNQSEDCVNVDDGIVHQFSFVSGELGRWCGSGFWGTPVRQVDDIDGGGQPDFVASEPGWNDPVTFGFQTGRTQLISAESGVLIREWTGSSTGARFGQIIDILGDIDGDGFRELLVGVGGHGSSDTGKLWIYSIATGNELRSHVGVGAYTQLGARVGALADLDGDGVADYAYSSTPGGVIARVTIRSGATGAKIGQMDGTSTHGPGAAIRPYVDVDGDGVDEILVSGAYHPLLSGYVEAYSIAKAKMVWRIDGTANFDQFGINMVSVGDVNGDNCSEVLISVPGDNTRGKYDGRVDLISGRTLRPLYVYYPPPISLDLFGTNVARGADFNLDGIPDHFVGSYNGGWSQWQGGFFGIYAGNDLYLQAEPQQPVDGDTVVVDLRGAAPGVLGLIALTAIDGNPLFETLLLAPFDANGELQLTADVDSSVSGMEFTLMGWSQNKNGRGPLVDASPFVVSVQ